MWSSMNLDGPEDKDLGMKLSKYIQTFKERNMPGKAVRFLSLCCLFVSAVFLNGCFGNSQAEKGFTRLEDFQKPGVRLAVIQGSASEIQARQYFSQNKLSFYLNASDALLALKDQKVDALAYDRDILENIAATVPDTIVVPQDYNSCDIAIGINKDQKQLLAQVNKALQNLKAGNIFKEMDNHWQSKDPAEIAPDLEKEDPGLPELKIGTSATVPPWMYMHNNKLTGFDKELSLRIAKALGRRTSFKIMEFDALIAALETGKVDLVISNLNETEERKQKIAFSQAYHVSRSTVLVLKKNWQGSGQAAAGSVVTTNTNGTITGRLLTYKESLKTSFTRNFIVEDRYKMILQGLKTTIIISLGAAVLGTILGFGLCMLRRSKRKLFNGPARIFIKVMQGTPLVVFLMIMYYIVFGKVAVNPIFVAILAFSINMAAYVAEMIRSGLDAVDKGQREAAYAMGFNKLQTFIKIVAPQALKYILPVYTGEFISLLKMTSVVGYIAIQDLTKMSDIIRSRTYEAFFPLIVTALIYLVVAWSLASVLAYLEYRIDTKQRPRQLTGIKVKS